MNKDKVENEGGKTETIENKEKCTCFATFMPKQIVGPIPKWIRLADFSGFRNHLLKKLGEKQIFRIFFTFFLLAFFFFLPTPFQQFLSIFPFLAVSVPFSFFFFSFFFRHIPVRIKYGMIIIVGCQISNPIH
jgi:hypothetical protein